MNTPRSRPLKKTARRPSKRFPRPRRRRPDGIRRARRELHRRRSVCLRRARRASGRALRRESAGADGGHRTSDRCQRNRDDAARERHPRSEHGHRMLLRIRRNHRVWAQGAVRTRGGAIPEAGATPVSAVVSGLAVAKVRHFRLVAASVSGAARSRDGSIKRPAVVSESVSHVSNDSALLETEVNPQGLDASYGSPTARAATVNHRAHPAS